MTVTTQDPFVRVLVDDLNDQVQSHIAQAREHRRQVEIIEAAKSAWLTASPRMYEFAFVMPLEGTAIFTHAFKVAADGLPDDNFNNAMHTAIMDFLLTLRKYYHFSYIARMQKSIVNGVCMIGPNVDFVLWAEHPTNSKKAKICVPIDHGVWGAILADVLQKHF